MSEMLLETRGLTKQYGHHKAVDSVSMHIKKGAIYGFIGRNGAGKTTCLKMISGLSKPTSGEIEIFGYKGKDLQKVRSRVGCLIEAPGLYGNMTAYENLNIKCKLLGIKKADYVEEILKTVGLEQVGRKKTKHFSLGMKQRLGIGLALVGEPDLLVLDEPINGLDPQGIAEVRDTIQRLQKERNMTICISSHILEELSKIATDYGIIHNGSLLQELTRDELMRRCSERMELTLDDPKRAIPVLDAMGFTSYQVTDKEHIHIFERLSESASLNMELMWKYQRQVKDICRQLAFLMKHDSNMLIHREFDLGGIGMLSDRLNDLLELRRKEKQYYQEKETLIADTYTNLSHDIRTPLTSLDGYFQLMEACENVEEQRRYLNIIHERIHSLNEMLEELFMFTKLKNESYRLELTSCCINRILKETVFSYYDDWVRREIQPDIQITEEQLYIDGNKQGLSRIIQNVIKNGLDHGEKKIRIVLKREQNQAVLRISNQVTASEQIDIEHVFDRFYKADAARSKTSTGLGLSIAREFVRRMNGEIGAKIEENEFIVEMSFPIII